MEKIHEWNKKVFNCQEFNLIYQHLNDLIGAFIKFGLLIIEFKPVRFIDI